MDELQKAQLQRVGAKGVSFIKTPGEPGQAFAGQPRDQVQVYMGVPLADKGADVLPEFLHVRLSPHPGKGSRIHGLEPDFKLKQPGRGRGDDLQGGGSQDVPRDLKMKGDARGKAGAGFRDKLQNSVRPAPVHIEGAVHKLDGPCAGMSQRANFSVHPLQGHEAGAALLAA